MRILVAGGAGFIGSNFIRHMLEKHSAIEVVNLDLLTYAGRHENLLDIKQDSHYKFVRGDIRKIDTVESVMKSKFDLVVNFAAETHVDRSIVKGDSFVLTDAYGTYILLEASRRHDVERFVQISTDEVYGSRDLGSFEESAMLNPSSLYSASKAAGDHIALAFHKTYGLRVQVVRSSNNYGPFQHPEKFIPKMILRALKNLTLPIYGDGRQVRDWLYVQDNCSAISHIAQKGKSGEIYNVATGEEHMNIKVAKRILAILRRPESLIKQVDDRPGHDRRYSVNNSKVLELGWKPALSLVEGLRDTIGWYKENEWWWATLINDCFFKADVPWTLEPSL